MRIGITGGLGFIGTALGREARLRGHEVVVYSRKPQPPPDWAVECRVLDLAEKPILNLGGLDAVVHLAGESVMGYWTDAKKQRIRDSRIPVTEALVEAMKATPDGPKVLLCASGTGAYGNRGDEVLTEKTPMGAGFLAEVCRDWEKAANEARQIPGGRVVLLRTGMVLGQGGAAWPMLKKIFSLRLGSRLGDGKQWVPWIHLDDEVGIILHLLENPACEGPFNLSAPNPVTNAEMTQQIASVLGTTTFIPTPAFGMKLLMGELASVVLESQRAVPQAALDSGYVFKHPQFREAVASLV